MSDVKKKPKKSDKSKLLWLKSLGIKIKQLRIANGLSQADLAYAIHMDSQNISRIERGLVNPSAYAVKQISLGLGISLIEIYKGLED